jgi:LPS sulfotransferase NodH
MSAPSLGTPGAKTQWFVVVGARRTGTNILREILNTNPEVAMLGEVFTPSQAPAHWVNFVSAQNLRGLHPITTANAISLVDDYFQFVEYRIRNHWSGDRKAASHRLGFDIKYDQLWQITPSDQPSASPPFLLSYFKLHQVLLIHTIRENVIKCAISEMIAQQRNLWHNYDSVRIDRWYYLDSSDCLNRARLIVKRRAEFERLGEGCDVLRAYYEQLAHAIAGARRGQMAEDAAPLKDIARALRVPFRFSYDGRLRRAIDRPYSSIISNHAELRRAVADSEFSQFAPTLD